MQRPRTRIVESPFDRAADVRARSNRALYWLERLGLFVLFGLGNFLVLTVEPDGISKWLGAIPIMILAGLWHLLDRRVQYRYGRKQRLEEILAEAEAKDIAGGLSGQLRAPPVVV